MNPQQQTTPPATTPPPAAKSNTTSWVILSLLVAASLLTGLAYFFLPSFLTKEETPITTTNQTADSQQVAKWRVYENTKYHYSFFYPVTWEIQNADADQKNFELHYTDGPDGGVIKINYLSSEERNKIQPYCETTQDPTRCYTYELTDKSNVLLEILTSETGQINKADALISRPAGEALRIQITDGNTISYETLTVLTDTLSFPGEQRKYGLTVCPDTWPTTKEYVTYNGVQIPKKELDLDWIDYVCSKQSER